MGCLITWLFTIQITYTEKTVIQLFPLSVSPIPTVLTVSPCSFRSAFAPDFKELDENVDYDERESEFDLEDEDKSVQLNEEHKDIDVEVLLPPMQL